MYIKTNIAELRKTRIKAGLNIKELSILSGVQRSTISGIETQGKNASPAVAKKLCDALEVDFDTLFEIKEGE